MHQVLHRRNFEAISLFVKKADFARIFAVAPDRSGIMHVPAVPEDDWRRFRLIRSRAMGRHLREATSLFGPNMPDAHVSPDGYGPEYQDRRAIAQLIPDRIS